MTSETTCIFLGALVYTFFDNLLDTNYFMSWMVIAPINTYCFRELTRCDGVFFLDGLLYRNTDS